MEFVHYTKNIDAVLGILRNGLFVNPVRRNLMHLFSGCTNNEREPQQFGMVSLRKDRCIGSKKHVEDFGYFGIVFRKEWVESVGFREVIYLKNHGSYCSYIKSLYDEAIHDLNYRLSKKDSSDAFWKMAYTNKGVAEDLGAKKYVSFLSLYEYLEPFENRNQKEIRYVSKIPLYYNLSLPTSDRISRFSKDGWDKVIMSLGFSSDDVLYFICPKEHIVNLRNSLPESFKNKKIKRKTYF